MKFRDNRGEIYNTLIEANLSSVANKIADKLFGTMDQMMGSPFMGGYPNSSGYYSRHDPSDIEDVEFEDLTNEEDDTDEVNGTQEEPMMGDPIPDTVNVIQSPSFDSEEADSVIIPTIISQSEKDHPVVAEVTPTDTNVETGASTIPYSRIEIDYATKSIRLMDDKGNVMSSSPIDPNLLKGTIDAELANILYPDGDVPANHSAMNVSSIPQGSNTGVDSVNIPDYTVPPTNIGESGSVG